MLCEVLAWFVKPVAQDESLKLSTMPGRRGLVSAREDAEEALAPAGTSAASWGLTLDPPVSCQDPTRGRAGRRADNGDTASACSRRRRSSICRGRAGLSQPGSRARCFDRNLLIFPQEDASRCSPTGGTARHHRRGTGSAAGPPGRGGFRRLSGSRLLRLAHSAVQVHRL